MRDILLFLLIFNKYDWNAVHFALKTNKIAMTAEKVIKIVNSIKCDWISIVDQNYPNWLKDISCPPFIIFYKGNIELLNQNNVYIIGDFDDICTQLINYLNNFGIIVNKELSSLKEDENLINSLKNNRMCFFMNKGISEFKNNLNKNFLYYSYVYSFGKYVFVEKEWVWKLQFPKKSRIIFLNCKVDENLKELIKFLLGNDCILYKYIYKEDLKIWKNKCFKQIKNFDEFKVYFMIKN